MACATQNRHNRKRSGFSAEFPGEAKAFRAGVISSPRRQTRHAPARPPAHTQKHTLYYVSVHTIGTKTTRRPGGSPQGRPKQGTTHNVATAKGRGTDTHQHTAPPPPRMDSAQNAPVMHKKTCMHKPTPGSAKGWLHRLGMGSVHHCTHNPLSKTSSTYPTTSATMGNKARKRSQP